MDIVTFQSKDLADVLALYRTVTDALRRQGLKQWDRFYPNRFVIKDDIETGCLYGIREGSGIVAAVCMNGQQNRRYMSVRWSDTAGSPGVIHRLAVHPGFQGKGIGRRMLKFAEFTARMKGYSSIRLDVCSANPGACRLYEQSGYVHRGIVTFPFRKPPYYCLEKVW